MTSGRNNRKVFTPARLSREYHLHVLIGGLAFAVVLFVFTYLKLDEINRLVATLSDRQVAIDLSQRVLVVAAISFVSCFLFIVLTSVYVYFMAQRVGGPVVAICRYVRDLREGRYDVNRALRAGDELDPIMVELRQLAKSLAAREGV